MAGEEWLDLALKSKDMGKKLEYFSKYLELKPDDRDVWEYKGTILSKIGRHSEAIDCFENAYIATGPQWQAAGLQFTSGYIESAIELYDEILQEKPTAFKKVFQEEVKVWLKNRASLKKGEALLTLNRWEEAVVCFDNSLKANLGKICDVTAWLRKGIALYGLGMFEEAIKCLDKALEIDPGHFVGWYLRGIHLINLERYEEAIACFDEALKIKPPITVEGMEDIDYHKRFAEENVREEKEEKLKRNKKHQERKGIFKKLFG